MRLISLIFALVAIAALIIYYKNSIVPVENTSDQTVREQTKQVIDEAKQATEQMQKTLEEQQRRMDEQLEQQQQ